MICIKGVIVLIRHFKWSPKSHPMTLWQKAQIPAGFIPPHKSNLWSQRTDDKHFHVRRSGFSKLQIMSTDSQQNTVIINLTTRLLWICLPAGIFSGICTAIAGDQCTRFACYTDSTNTAALISQTEAGTRRSTKTHHYEYRTWND